MEDAMRLSLCTLGAPSVSRDAEDVLACEPVMSDSSNKSSEGDLSVHPCHFDSGHFSTKLVRFFLKEKKKRLLRPQVDPDMVSQTETSERRLWIVD